MFVAGSNTAATPGLLVGPDVVGGRGLVPVPEVLSGLFPEGGLRQGTTLGVRPGGAGRSLALGLAAPLTRAGGWAALVGVGDVGFAGADELGVDLSRLVSVPQPGRSWADVVAALVEGFDLVMLQPPGPDRPVREREARLLSARARERGAVMLVLDSSRWPLSTDLLLSAGEQVWEGLGRGHGRLSMRRVEVVLGGRRSGGRDRQAQVWLPGPGGGLEAVTPVGAVSAPGASRESDSAGSPVVAPVLVEVGVA